MQTTHTFPFSSEALHAMYLSYSIQMDYRTPESDPIWYISDFTMDASVPGSDICAVYEYMDFDHFALHVQNDNMIYHLVAKPCIEFAIEELGYSQSLFPNLI